MTVAEGKYSVGDGDEPFAYIPTTTPPVPDNVVQWAITTLETMNVLDVIAEWRIGARLGPGGRPESFPMHALLAAMVVAAHTKQAMHASVFRDILFVQISPAMRSILFVPEPPGPLDLRGWRSTYRNVRTRLHELLGVMDPSDRPKNRRLDHNDYELAAEALRATRTDAERATCEECLTWFCNRVLEASIAQLPRRYRRKMKGDVAVDATNIGGF